MRDKRLGLSVGIGVFLAVKFISKKPQLVMKDKLVRRALWIFVSVSVAMLLTSVFNIKTGCSNAARIDNAISLYQNSMRDSLKRDSFLRDLNIMKVKEDYFMDQIGIQSDWFIAYVSILFVIFGFIGFSIFDGQIKQMREENEIFKERHTRQVDELQQQFFDLQNTLLQDFTDLKQKLNEEVDILKLEGYVSKYHNMYNISTHAFNIKQHAASINRLLLAVKYLLMNAVPLMNYDGKRKNRSVDEALSHLKWIQKKTSTWIDDPTIQGKFIKDFEYEENIAYIDNIFKFDHKEIRDVVMEIRHLFRQIQDRKVGTE